MVFGSGGGTSSYRTWSTPTSISSGARTRARRTRDVLAHAQGRGQRGAPGGGRSAPHPLGEAAHEWLPIRVGADIALANAMGHVIIEEGLQHHWFIDHATTGFEEYKQHRRAVFTPNGRSRSPASRPAQIRCVARAIRPAETRMICWTLGITEHHNAVDNVLALINLGLLTGKVGRPGCGLNPLRGQNNVQGGGDMGALPDRLPGFQPVENDDARAQVRALWGVHDPAEARQAPDRDARRPWSAASCAASTCWARTPCKSDADAPQWSAVPRARLPGGAGYPDDRHGGAGRRGPARLRLLGRVDGTVTNSERRVQLCRKAIDPPGEARDDCAILQDLANRLGATGSTPPPRRSGMKLRALSPHARRHELRATGRAQRSAVALLRRDASGETRLHSAAVGRAAARAARVPSPRRYEPPVDEIDAEYPLVLTTGRRLEFYNTGVQTARYDSRGRRKRSWISTPTTPDRTASRRRARCASPPGAGGGAAGPHRPRPARGSCS